jgi:hypothetical protein
MMAEYYTMETVREQILQKGKVDSASVSGFPTEWNYSPCVIAGKCDKGDRIFCMVRLGILFNVPHSNISIIEIIYVRENHHGFVRTDNAQLKKLIERGIINEKSLEKVTLYL